MSYRKSQAESLAEQAGGCLLGGVALAGIAVYGLLHELFAPLPGGIRVGRKPGTGRAVGLDERHLTRHVSIIGPTGTGKTVTAANLAVNLARKGYGFCLIDPKGGFIDSVLPHLPPSRFDDIIL